LIARPSKTVLWAVPALLALNLCLKLGWHGTHELAGDEPFTVYWAQRPLSELFGMLRTENNPPLYFLIMHYWSMVVPLDPSWLRVPSALVSSLAVWPLFLLGRRMGGVVTGFTAALLYTFSQHHFQFAHEARTYSLLVLACTWAAWQLVRLADAPRYPSLLPPSVLWLVAANTIATWTHYFGWLMIGLELVMAFSVAALRPVRAKLLAAIVLIALLNLPLFGVLLARAGTSLGHGTWLQAPAWDEPYSMLVRWSNAPVVAVIFLVLIGLAVARRGMGASFLAISGLWCGVPLVLMFLVSYLFPVYLDRYLLFASMGFYLLVAQTGLRHPLGKVPPWLIQAGCVLAMGITFSPWAAGTLHPSRVVAQVDRWRDEHTAVIIQPGWYGLSYAWAVSPQFFKGAAPVELALKEQHVYPLEGSLMPPLDSTVTSVVQIDAWASLTDPGHSVLNALRSRFHQIDSSVVDEKVILRRFTR
jgi:hypothetical protein